MNILGEILYFVFLCIAFVNSSFILDDKMNTTTAETKQLTSTSTTNETVTPTTDKFYSLRAILEAKLRQPSTTSTSTRDPILDYLWGLPRQTITPHPMQPLTLDNFMKNMYTKYGIDFKANVSRVFINTLYDSVTLPYTKSTEIEKKNETTTESYLDQVLNIWIRDGNRSVHSFTDPHAGMPMRVDNYPDYDTFFGNWP